MFIKGALFLVSLLSIPFIVNPSWANLKAGEVVEFIGANGGVNWTRGRVMVESTADEKRSFYKACRASAVIAQRDLVEIIGGVRVDSETLVEDNVLSKDWIRTAVNGQLRGGQITSRDKNADGSCTVHMQVSLAGPLATGIYRHQMEREQTKHWLGRNPIFAALDWFITPAHANMEPPWQRDLDKLRKRLEQLEKLLRTQPAVVSQAIASGDPTGLVIDARGSNFIPSMSPKLRRIRGEVLYPGRHSKAHKEGRLVSLFMNDVSAAQTHPRVGERPLSVKALRTWGKFRSEIVLGKKSSKIIADLVKKNILDYFPVIIVLD